MQEASSEVHSWQVEQEGWDPRASHGSHSRITPETVKEHTQLWQIRLLWLKSGNTLARRLR